MLRVWIGSWRQVVHPEPSKSYTVFVVEVTTLSGRYFMVEKRFSAFHALNMKCKEIYLLEAEFPPKKLSNTSSKVRLLGQRVNLNFIF